MGWDEGEGGWCCIGPGGRWFMDASWLYSSLFSIRDCRLISVTDSVCVSSALGVLRLLFVLGAGIPTVAYAQGIFLFGLGQWRDIYGLVLSFQMMMPPNR